MLDFTVENKHVLEVKLKNGKEVSIYTPTVEQLDALTSIDYKKVDLKKLINTLAAIISNNAQGYKCTPAELSKYDLEELYLFLNEIMNFVTKVANGKNA